MRGSLFRRNPHPADKVGLGGKAVVCGDVIGHAFAHRHVAPREEAMQLLRVLTPAARLYHQVGWPPARRLVLGQLAKYGFVGSKRGIHQKEFDEERPLLAGYGVVAGKAMPPPVVSLLRKRAFQHKLIP